jgi:hypothetical protein
MRGRGPSALAAEDRLQRIGLGDDDVVLVGVRGEVWHR